jgi:nucleoid-associated protein YgaU
VAKSRYSDNKIIDGYYYGSWRNRLVEGSIEPDIFENITTIEHTVSVGERLDHLSARYFGDDQYYWVIAVVNSIIDPLDISPGRKLRIPTDVRQILERMM